MFEHRGLFLEKIPQQVQLKELLVTRLAKIVVISIPTGAIKSDAEWQCLSAKTLFQFQLVQLKES